MSNSSLARAFIGQDVLSWYCLGNKGVSKPLILGEKMIVDWSMELSCVSIVYDCTDGRRRKSSSNRVSNKFGKIQKRTSKDYSEMIISVEKRVKHEG